MTFHRIDPSVMRSPSVGLPARYVGYLLVFAVLVFVGYGSVEVLNADARGERAFTFFKATENAQIVRPAAGPR